MEFWNLPSESLEIDSGLEFRNLCLSLFGDRLWFGVLESLV